MMKLELHKEAVLTCEVPAHPLKSGDTIKVVDHRLTRDGREGYFIEVLNAAATRAVNSSRGRS